MPAAEPRSSSSSRSRGARRCLRQFFGHLFSNIGLFSLIVGYVLLGAVLFEFLEADVDLQQRDNIQQYREDCLKELWLITERLNVLYEKNWTHLVHEQLRKFETSVATATEVDLMDSSRQWSFSGALLYSVTVITTIGYGNLAPRTATGKVVTMIYAVIGVPLMLLCLSNLGSFLADTFQFAYSQACCCHSNPPIVKHRHHYDKHLHPPACNRQASRAPSYTSQASGGGHDTSSTIVEVTCGKSETPRNATVISNGGRPRLSQRSRQSRPLPSEVRTLLTECAEYTLAQNTADPSTARLLKQLKEPESEEDRYETDDTCDGDDADLELGDAGGHHNTPSRIPLIWRSNCESHTSKRPPTPPPRRSRSGTPPDDAPPRTARVPVYIVLLVLTGYICLGATVFAAWEDWTFLDGAYFCFITLSTIGFGDLVPGKSFQRVDTEGGQLQLVACCAYLMLGLVLIAMSFTLVQEEVLNTCRHIALTIGILKRRDPH